MHVSLRSGPISNSGSPQDHLPMSIILTPDIGLHPVCSKHFNTMQHLPVKFQIVNSIPDTSSLAFGCWDIHLFRGNSDSAITINILAFAFELLASSLSTNTPLSQLQLNSLLNSYGSPFQELSQLQLPKFPVFFIHFGDHTLYVQKILNFYLL